MKIQERFRGHLAQIPTQKRASEEGGPGRISSAISAGREAFGNLSPEAQGAVVGGGAGSIFGAIGMAIRANPEEGRSRLRQALKGLVGGGVAGAAVGAGTGHMVGRRRARMAEGGRRIFQEQRQKLDDLFEADRNRRELDAAFEEAAERNAERRAAYERGDHLSEDELARRRSDDIYREAIHDTEERHRQEDLAAADQVERERLDAEWEELREGEDQRRAEAARARRGPEPRLPGTGFGR